MPAPSSQFVPLWMPALWGTGLSLPLAGRLPSVLCLWPGLPEPLARPAEAGRFTPETLPLSKREMGRCLAELERFAAENARGGAEAASYILDRARADHRARLERELADIRALGGKPAMAETDVAERAERAQRMLAWFWFQQRQLADIDGLVRQVNAAARNLGLNLSRDTEEAPGLKTGIAPLASDLAPGLEELGGDWRVWLEAALALTPENTIFVCPEVPAGLELPEESGSMVPAAWGLSLPETLKARVLEMPAAGLLPSAAQYLPARPVRLVFLSEKEADN